ncbi:hypothetical protein AC739_17470 [Planococcus glaciei]|nr:hypothetical protein AC739_17470 [Planococcus glaciei]
MNWPNKISCIWILIKQRNPFFKVQISVLFKHTVKGKGTIILHLSFPYSAEAVDKEFFIIILKERI